MTIAVFMGSLLGAMALGIPIAFALLASGVALMWHLDMLNFQILAQNLIGGADSFPLLAVPFFAGRRADERRQPVPPHRRSGAGAGRPHQGRPGYVVIMAGCLLSALSGSAVADAATLTALLLPMMVKAGHDRKRGAGLIAATGVIGPVIPPSIGLVIFGVAANVSIAKLFLAAIVPGLRRRDPKQYGKLTLDDIDARLQELAGELGVRLEHFQSNIEGGGVQPDPPGPGRRRGRGRLQPGGLDSYLLGLRAVVNATGPD